MGPETFKIRRLKCPCIIREMCGKEYTCKARPERSSTINGIISFEKCERRKCPFIYWAPILRFFGEE